MKSLKLATLILVCLLTCKILPAQVSLADSAVGLWMINIEYNGNAPAGDMVDRYGFTSTAGATIGRKFASNFYILGGFRALFGSNVKDSIGGNIMNVYFDPVINSYAGSVIGADGKFTDVRFQERGYVIPLTVGKLFPVFPKLNPNTGLYAELGGQFIQHKIHLEVVGGDVPALDKDYRKGYDRMTNGFGLVQGLGFRYFGNDRLINFHVGLEASQNFTKSRRSINIDTGTRDTESRLDMMFGFKLGWTFLIYKQAPERYYEW